MRIYISGPVTGMEDTAKYRFEEAAAQLALAFAGEEKKPSVIDPFSANDKIFRHFNEIPTHDDYMITSMAMLEVCDTIFLLKGWERSEGCQQEYQYAKAHGYRILYQKG